MPPSSDKPLTNPYVVLVDDHHDTRLMYAEFLGHTMEIRTVEDGRKALEVLSVRRPDLVITDLSLPGMDGLELVALIRKNPLLSGVPIICLSGYGGIALEERARQAGVNRLIQKPCLPDALAAIVEDVLRESQGRAISR
jgi:CheY-like chemotaxis protein